jgi:hypothetical protein
VEIDAGAFEIDAVAFGANAVAVNIDADAFKFDADTFDIGPVLRDRRIVCRRSTVCSVGLDGIRTRDAARMQPSSVIERCNSVSRWRGTGRFPMTARIRLIKSRMDLFFDS